VVVIGAGYGETGSRFVLPLEVGTAAAPLRRYAFRVEDFRTEQPLGAAKLTILNGSPNDLPQHADSVAALTTDASGQAEVSLACSGDSSGYWVRIEAPGHYSKFFSWSAARCGVPERALYRLVPNPQDPGPLKSALSIIYR
jgi:hypothetical protein